MDTESELREEKMSQEIKRLMRIGLALEKELDYLKKTSITWTVMDFERCASLLELLNEKNVWSGKCTIPAQIYDRSKFEDALFAMIKSHDAMKGITLDIVEQHLNTLCLKDKITESLKHPKERLAPLNPGKRNKGFRL